MLESGRNWELFGYDLRNVGKHWSSAWHDLLWAYDSPVRARLDEPVLLHSANGTTSYQAGRPSRFREPTCHAMLIPDDLVLVKSLDYPAAVESDLESVIALEVQAASPFAQSDTGYGWRIEQRNESTLQVSLAIVSVSAVMTYIANEHQSHDPKAQEVWAEVAGTPLVIDGFGEQVRTQFYNKRLRRVVILLGIAAMVVASIVGVWAGLQRLQLQELETAAARAQSGSQEAVALRTKLAASNEKLASVSQVVANFPNPHRELARLTRVLDDDVSVDRLTIKGLKLSVRGKAADAASVMQKLNDEQDYIEVTAPRAISRAKNTNLDHFLLDVKRRGEVGE